jgi:LmbE family N-acetylglucosaminyl deacetylase/glycosyltransferase involved in cell wall biosynthesis
MIPPAPGTTTPVAARSVLVVAPHYDDEVLGCGGLVAALTAKGAAVRVLFLTDGSGGVESVEDRAAYAARRREEAAAALAVLGVSGSEHLALPDGELARRGAELREALERALLALRPDLVLVPSPLEATLDHRAAFAALFGVVSPARPGDALHEALAGTRFLLYEVNHPGYPDLLVDVGAQLPRIEAAMHCYASQQERHDYLAAGIGLRRYRALSLPNEVSAAEAYRALERDDLTTRSLARLVRDLGGVPELLALREGPPVSVVVRTCDRPALLAEALASLAASTYRAVELVLVTDGGPPARLPDGFPFPVRSVHLPERRGRADAANAGIAAATGAYVGFLDDDDLLEPEHLATLAGLVAGAGTRVAYTDAAVGVYAPDPERGWLQVERRLPYSRDFDADLLLLDNYIPFNTLLIERELLLAAGGPGPGPLDPTLPFFEDWELLIRLAQRTPFLHCRQVTCEYRHFRGGGHVFGERPRERPDFLAVKARVLDRHRGLLTAERLAAAIDRLRGEEVAAREAERGARDAARRAEQDRLLAEDAYHRTHGEAAALRGERERLLAEVATLGDVAAARERELQRLFGEEAALRRGVEEREEHLRRVYAEIERLEALLAAMRATRAWRLHEWVERRRA